jgi:hypothetical protein
MTRIRENHLASTAFNASGEEGHQRKAKAMVAPSSEDDGALMRESDEEKKVVHWKDPHVGAVENREASVRLSLVHEAGPHVVLTTRKPREAT